MDWEKSDETTTGYAIWNATDGVFFDPRTFSTQEDASAVAEERRAAYGEQGSYRTADGLRISPEDLELEIVLVTE